MGDGQLCNLLEIFCGRLTDGRVLQMVDYRLKTQSRVLLDSTNQPVPIKNAR